MDGRRWFGGQYEIVPNGVELNGLAGRARSPSRRGSPRAVRRPPDDRKGLPVLLRAFEGLSRSRARTPHVVGTGADEVARNLPTPS